MGELPYTWAFPLLPYNEAVVEDSKINFTLIDWTDEDYDYALFWQELYVNFAKTG